VVDALASVRPIATSVLRTSTVAPPLGADRTAGDFQPGMDQPELRAGGVLHPQRHRPPGTTHLAEQHPGRRLAQVMTPLAGTQRHRVDHDELTLRA